MHESLLLHSSSTEHDGELEAPPWRPQLGSRLRWTAIVALTLVTSTWYVRLEKAERVLAHAGFARKAKSPIASDSNVLLAASSGAVATTVLEAAVEATGQAAPVAVTPTDRPPAEAFAQAAPAGPPDGAVVVIGADTTVMMEGGWPQPGQAAVVVPTAPPPPVIAVLPTPPPVPEVVVTATARPPALAAAPVKALAVAAAKPDQQGDLKKQLGGLLVRLDSINSRMTDVQQATNVAALDTTLGPVKPRPIATMSVPDGADDIDETVAIASRLLGSEGADGAVVHLKPIAPASGDLQTALGASLVGEKSGIIPDESPSPAPRSRSQPRGRSHQNSDAELDRLIKTLNRLSARVEKIEEALLDRNP